jgi:PAS domain S-box-containing protein
VHIPAKFVEWLRHTEAGILLRQAAGPGQLKIGVRLTLCFLAIVLLMASGDIVTLWQFSMAHGQAQRLIQVDQKSVSVLRVHADLLAFRDQLDNLVATQDARRFAVGSIALRQRFLEGAELASQALQVPPRVERDPTMLSTLETVQSALPAQIDALTDLAASSDWQAVRLRVHNQVTPLSALTSALVEKVDREVAEERAQSLESIRKMQRRVFVMLPITAIFTLLVAGMLGVSVTGSITRPLADLDAGAQAWAMGKFQHQVAVAGHDELATLAMAFNDAARRLQDLYGALKSSEERFRTLVETAQVGIAVLDQNSTVLLCNPAVLDMLGWTDEQVLGKRADDPQFNVLREDGSPCPVEERPSAKALATRKEVRDVALQIHRPLFGDWVWVLANARPLFRPDGSLYQVIATFTDLTQQKRSEEALRRSEAEFRIIFENAAIGIALVDPAGRPLRSNRALQTMLGYSNDELTAITFVHVTHPNDVTLDSSLFQDVVDGRLDRYQIKKRYIRKDGEVCWARLMVSALREADGSLQYCVAMVEDITARELAEQSIRQLSTRMLRIQEEEQRRIAREVHDSTSQEMTALTLNLGALLIAEDKFSPKARKQISESLALAKRVAREIRTFSYLLHPPMLSELGLWAALRLFVQEFRERSGLRVNLQISGTLEGTKLDPGHEMTLFRFVQEALANIHRHSGSRTASVDIQLHNRWIKASVTDTGRGIAPKMLRDIQSAHGRIGGVGIPGMKERIGNVGGHLEIESNARGTTITAMLPAEFAESLLRKASRQGVP